MRISKCMRRMLLALLAAAATGCAGAYHDYQDQCRCVPYDYCPPPPLPYTPYRACLTPWAKCYLDKTTSVPPAAAQKQPPGAGQEEDTEQ